MAWLEAHNIDHEFTDLRTNPPAHGQLARWSERLGSWEKMINRAGYTWRGLPAEETAGLGEAEARLLALKYPALIRRPLIEHNDGRITVGFSKAVQETLA